MNNNTQQLEDLENCFCEYLKARVHNSNFYALKAVIINLAVRVCSNSDQELQQALQQSLALWRDRLSYESLRPILADRSYKLDESIHEYGVDSKEAWEARLYYTALHDRNETDDVLIDLIIDFATINEFDAIRLTEIVIDHFPGFTVNMNTK